MQPSSDQFKQLLNETHIERGSADVIELVDNARQTFEFDDALAARRAQEEKIALKAVMTTFMEEAVVAEPEKQPIEPYIQHLGQISDLIKSYQDVELKNVKRS